MENLGGEETSPLPGVAMAVAALALDPHLIGVAVPGDPELVEDAARRLAKYLAALSGRPAPLERLPSNADLPALLGGVDVMVSIAGRHVELRKGILERARGGVLLIPDPDLLRPELAGPLHTALKRAGVRVVLGRGPGGPGWPGLVELCGLLPERTGGKDWVEPQTVLEAASLRAQLELSDDQLAGLAAAAIGLGVAGWRVDALAARMARAGAALHGRERVSDEDLLAALSLVIAPRATRQAETEPPLPQQEQPENEAGEPEDGDEESHSSEERRGPAGEQDLAERLIAAARASLPANALRWPRRAVPLGRKTMIAAGRSRSEASAPREQQTQASSGRPGRAVAARRRPAGAILDPLATLAAALPFQPLRREIARQGKHQAGGERRVLLRPEDLRWRPRQARPGVLFILAVDSSGSMARNRMALAKGAALALLERAYRHRDRVALLAFRGKQAALLLPPTRSTARAARLIQALPAGGGTPLASALETALRVQAQARRQGFSRTMLVLLTDGRGNVPLSPGGDPRDEIELLAGAWAALVDSGEAVALVVDTRARFLGHGEAAGFATAMRARYLRLPGAAGDEIERAAQQMVGAAGWRGSGTRG